MAEGATYGLMRSSFIPVADIGQIDAGYCLRFLRLVRDCSFATVDAEGLPAVRVIDVMHVEDGRLYFLVPRGKEFYREILRNPVVAIVGQTTDFRTCRLRGRVVRAEDGMFRIDRGACLRCGLCEETCPHGAIRRIGG